MAQKVNPISLRLQQTNREFDNCWYTDYFYRKLVSRDLYLQQYINSFLKLVKYPSARFSIQYSTKNIKLYSFLCYPKQSREVRSRMFGIAFTKKRKNKVKKNDQQLFSSLKQSFRETNKKEKRGLTSYEVKRNTYSSFLHNKKELHGKNRIKILKFLIDHNLWFRVYNPFTPLLFNNKVGSFLYNKKESPVLKKSLKGVGLINSKKQSHVLVDNKTTQLNKNILSFTKMYHVILLRVYKNKHISYFKNSRLSFDLQSNKIPGNYLLPSLSNQFSQTNKQQLLSLPFGRFLLYKKQLNSKMLSSKNNQKGNDLLYFIKNFLITLFFIRVLSTPVSFLQTKKETTKKLSQQFLFDSSFLQTKKEIKKNKYHSKYINFSNFNLQYRKNYIKLFLVFYLLYTEYNKNICLNTQNTLNLVSCFSIFQPLSIFHTILQKKTPLNLLLEENSKWSSFLQSKKETSFSFFYKIKKTQDLNFFKISPFLNTIAKKNEKKLQQFKYKNYIQHFLCSQYNLNTEFLPFGVSQDWQSAGFLADEIVYFLERRVTFRRLKHKIIKKIAENSSIRGVRISCSGRVGGKSKKAQRAKTECVKYGQTSRHTFSSRIDFAVRTARTSFGSVGIKVWICYN